MGYVICDGIFYGDRPYRGLGTEGCIPTVFDAHAMRNTKRVGADEDVWTYADRQLKLRLTRQAARRFRDGGHVDWMRVVGKVMFGLPYKPIAYIVAVLEHERVTGAGRRADVSLNAALIYARYERRRERVAMTAVAAE